MTMRLMGAVGIPAVRTRVAESVGIKRGYAVAQGAADNGGALIAVAGTRAVGIAGDLPDAGTAVGDAFPCVSGGETIAVAGAPIAAGNYLKADGTSRLVPVAAGAGTSEEVIGRAVSSAVAAADEFVINVHPFVLTTPAAV